MLEGPGQISRLDDCAPLVLIATRWTCRSVYRIQIRLRERLATGLHGQGASAAPLKRTIEAAPGTYCHSIQLPAAISQRQLEIESAEEFGVHIRVIKMDI